ncbi:MAG TPA: cytochrome c [Anaerolineae bacterium]
MPLSQLPGPITGSLEGDIAILVLAAALIVALRAVDRHRMRSSRLVSLAGSLVIAGVAAYLFIDAINSPNPQFANAPVDEVRAASGKPLYEQYCLTCHGASGHGDGPTAASQSIKPLDLTIHIYQHDETYLTLVIAKGMVGMPSFGGTLTVSEIGDVLAYMRLLARQARNK